MNPFAQFKPELVIAGTMAVLVWLWMRRMRSSHSAALAPHRSLGTLKQESPPTSTADMPSAMLRWQVELHEIARDTKAEIDTKMRALQAITRSATEAAERLERAIARAERLGLRESEAELRPVTRPTTPEIQRITLAAQDRVYALADAAHSPAEIAATTGLTVGDVEFLLALRPTRSG